MRFERSQVPPPPASTAVLALVAVTGVCAVVAAVAERQGLPLVGWAVLEPAAFWRGQVWRIVTWAFVDGSAIELALRLALTYWLGRDLASAWGARRFIQRYFLFVAATGAATCALARAVPPLLGEAWLGGWPIVEALTICWATTFGEREMYFLFVLRLGGRRLILAVVALTLTTGLFLGFAAVAPHLVAEGLALADASGWWPRDLVRRFQRWRLRRRGPRLHIVEDDEDPGPRDPPRWLN